MRRLPLMCALMMVPGLAGAYPTDPAAQELTKIRRLKWQQDVNEGERRGRRIPEGAQWPMSAIELRMLGNRDFDLTAETPKDPLLQKGLEAILKKWRWRRYNVAILDISDPNEPRWAGVHEAELQTPGSTAKVLLAGGMFQALADRFPDDVEARRKVLIETMVPADNWLMPNHHEVPVIIGDVYAKDYRSWIRSVRSGDTFSLYEWMDHALSPSSNASASMLWREAMLLRLLAEDYPPAKWDAELYGRWDREALTKAAFETVDAPLLGAGLGTEQFYIRMFFTRGANKYIKSGASRASPLGLLRWLLRVEQGRMVDEFSSLELKRMLYLTRRRIRYAIAPVLDTSATFFKTGSLYSCQPEEGYTCGAYKGNAVNVLNALIVVETPKVVAVEAETAAEGAGGAAGAAGAAADGNVTGEQAPAKGTPPAPAPEPAKIEIDKVYLVTVMSNELKRNAAEDHARLAAAIHELITAPLPSPTPTPTPTPTPAAP